MTKKRRVFVPPPLKDPTQAILGILELLPKRLTECKDAIASLTDKSTEQDIVAVVQSAESIVRMLRDMKAARARVRIHQRQATKRTMYQGNVTGREPTERELRAAKSRAILLDAQGQTRRKGSRRAP